jgi:hypothetical protein
MVGLKGIVHAARIYNLCMMAQCVRSKRGYQGQVLTRKYNLLMGVSMFDIQDDSDFNNQKRVGNTGYHVNGGFKRWAIRCFIYGVHPLG